LEVVKILQLEQRPLTVDDLRNEVNYYKDRDPELQGLLDFYLSIFELQHQYLSQIEVDISLTDDEIKRKLKKQQHLLEGEDVRIDPRIFKSQVNDLVQVIETKSTSKGNLHRLIEASELDEENIPTFIEKLTANDSAYLAEFAESTEIDRDIIFFIAQISMSPFYQKYAENLRPRINYSMWLYSSCPVCGRRPLAAKLKEKEGLRLLQCSLCQTQWWFLRLKCAFCGNTDHEKLQYLYVEEDRGRRVDVCDSCGKYIKTFDERVIGREVIPHIEEIASVRLDFIAKKEGYVPGAQYMVA
jgi:formate dehydrogenase accessory protein FdhE